MLKHLTQHEGKFSKLIQLKVGRMLPHKLDSAVYNVAR